MRVLLADDHALFREGVRLVLENLVDGPLEVVEAGDFVQAVAALRAGGEFDVGLVDLNMPGMDGFDGIEAVCRAAPNMHLVVISASESPSDVRRALDAGAQGYIAKTSSSSSMLDAIRQVLSGDTYLSPRLEVASANADVAGRDQARNVLTPRQRDVLAMLRQGKSNKEIARQLGITERTVKAHTGAIFEKLGVRDRMQLALVVHGRRSR